MRAIYYSCSILVLFYVLDLYVQSQAIIFYYYGKCAGQFYLYKLGNRSFVACAISRQSPKIALQKFFRTECASLLV
jgi:hypothetical protein